MRKRDRISTVYLNSHDRHAIKAIISLDSIDLKTMVGVKGRSGRKDLDPGLVQHQFQQIYDWDESCNEKMTLRMPSRMKQELKEKKLPNWQEVARLAIARELGWSVEDVE